MYYQLSLVVSASRVSDRQVSHLAQQIMRFLQLKHGSLLKAALGSSQDLNNVIGRLLYDTLFGRALRTEMSRNLEALIDQVPMLHLPDDIQFQVEDALNQFESSDFQVSTLQFTCTYSPIPYVLLSCIQLTT